MRGGERSYAVWACAATEGAAATDAVHTERALRRQNAASLDLARADAIDAGHLEEAFRRITEAAAAGLGCARSSVWLYADGDSKIVLQDLYQPADRSHGGQGSELLARDFPGYFDALREDRTITADDAHQHPATREFSAVYLTPLGITSMLEAPIRHEGRLIGVLCNEHVGPPRGFSQDEQNFVASVADHVGRALGAAARREADAALARYTASLENRVAERTRALQLILDSTGDGLLACDLEGRLAGECSSVAVQWFGAAKPGQYVWDYLFPDAPDEALSFRVGLDQIVTDELPFELLAEQMPQAFSRGGTDFGVSYRRVVEEGRLVRLLAVVRDATAERLAARAEREARELQAIAAHLARDRSGLAGFREETDSLVRGVAEAGDLVVAWRMLHTIKGNAAVFGLEALAETAHALEDRLADAPERLGTAELTAALEATWLESRVRISRLLDDDSGGRRVELDVDEYEAFLTDLVARRVDGAVLHTVRSWRAVPTRAVLQRLAGQAIQLGHRLGKAVDVSVDGGSMRAPRDDLGAFFAALVHIVRNAVDHGLEPPEERIAAGKLALGRLSLRTGSEHGAFVVEVADDGRGIDWSSVRGRAAALGLPAETASDLERALVSSGFSTRAAASQVSGRGVGVDAAAAACEALGGTLAIRSTPGMGSTFRFSIPAALPADPTATR